jgi:hypothetical protein
VSTCALAIEEWDDAQRGGSKISQRDVRLRVVPVDGPDDAAVTPDGVPMSEISVADDLARPNGFLPTRQTTSGGGTNDATESW